MMEARRTLPHFAHFRRDRHWHNLLPLPETVIPESIPNYPAPLGLGHQFCRCGLLGLGTAGSAIQRGNEGRQSREPDKDRISTGMEGSDGDEHQEDRGIAPRKLASMMVESNATRSGGNGIYESSLHPWQPLSVRVKRLFCNNFTNRATYRVAVLSSIF
jgi:hypothetical protein